MSCSRGLLAEEEEGSTGSGSGSGREQCVAKISQLRTGVPLSVKLRNGDAAFVVRVEEPSQEQPEGAFFCLGDVCPHSDAKLHSGDIEDIGLQLLAEQSSNTAADSSGPSGAAGLENLSVKCPKHRKKFCGNGLFFGLHDGRARVIGATSKFDPTWYVPTYSVRADTASNKVFVTVPEHKHVSTCTKRVWEKWTLGSRTRHSHDSWVFHFERSTEQNSRGLLSSSRGGVAGPTQTASADEAHAAWADSPHSSAEQTCPPRQCWHVTLKLSFRHLAKKKSVKREYTPISDEDDFNNGSMDILIKVYPQGKLTSRLARMKEGDSVLVSGPEETLPLPSLRPSIGWNPAGDSGLALSGDGEGPGTQLIGCVVGGTGIAPVMQLLRIAAAFRDTFGGGRPQFRVIFSNHTEEDILLKEALDDLSKDSALDFRILHTLTGGSGGKVSKKWSGSTGRICPELCEGFLPPPSPDTTVILCGPAGMNAAALQILRDAGYEEHCLVELEA